jgi:hypothetical protein
MDFAALDLLPLGGFSLNAATVVLLYKIHRDNRDRVAESRWQRFWIEKIRRALWPETFSHGDGEEPNPHGH